MLASQRAPADVELTSINNVKPLFLNYTCWQFIAKSVQQNGSLHCYPVFKIFNTLELSRLGRTGRWKPWFYSKGKPLLEQ